MERPDTNCRKTDNTRSTDAADYQHTRLAVAVMAKTYPDGAAVAPHAHRRHQLIWAIQGVMRVDIAAGVWVVPPSRALFVPAGLVHAVRMAGAVHMRTMYVEPAFMPPHTAPAGGKLVAVSPLLRALLLEAASWRLDRADHRASLVASLILDELTTLADEPLRLPMPEDTRLRRVCEAIRADPARAWTLEHWADTAGTSARTLARLFLRETGTRFHDWRQQARLEAALTELARGGNVATAALRAGYASPSAFTAAFRRAMGTTPREHTSK